MDTYNSPRKRESVLNVSQGKVMILNNQSKNTASLIEDSY